VLEHTPKLPLIHALLDYGKQPMHRFHVPATTPVGGRASRSAGTLQFAHTGDISMTTTLPFFQVDAFTNQPFKGNPAAVFILDQPLDDLLMQNIAIEMNLAETAFVLLRDNQPPLLRWFTPTFEIDLCGHATLASANIYLNVYFPEQDSVTFDTKFIGSLRVDKTHEGYTMDFPSRPGKRVEIDDVPSFVLNALSEQRPTQAYKSRDLMLVYDNDAIIRAIDPDFQTLKAYEDFIIVTAPSDNARYDMVSRVFCPNDVVLEDPVTGSAHCTIAPYWTKRLGKTCLHAYQASERGGELSIEMQNDRVLISGAAVTVIKGVLQI